MKKKQLEEKISEYERKLAQKFEYVVRRGSKKVIKTKGVSKHLGDFYRKEIALLEREKNFIIDEHEIIEVTWVNIFFENNFILIKFKNHYSLPFTFPSSRKSFQFIKPFLEKRNLPTIKALITGREIKSIENLQYFSEAVEILNIKTFFKDLIEEDSGEIFGALKHSLNKLNNITTKQVMGLFDRGDYLKYLCEIQEQEFKIIPVPESIRYHEGSKEEDTFIFTIKQGNHIFIIWESANLSRATYLFKINPSNYASKIHSFLSYIIGSEKNKRSTLRKVIKHDKNSWVVEHDGFELWKIRIKSFILI